MRILRSTIFLQAIIAQFLLSNSAEALKPAPSTQAGSPIDADPTSADIQSGDPARLNNAVLKIRSLLTPSHIPTNLWRRWLPDLLYAKDYKDVVDLSRISAPWRPKDGIAPILQLRALAFIAMNNPQEALATAKSYYNICADRDFQTAVDLVSQAFALSNPTDKTIEVRFRNEQAFAAQEGSATNDEVSTAKVATTQESGMASMLQGVSVDADMYAEAIDYWGKKSATFDNRNTYGILLLASGRSKEAEILYRGLFQTAKTRKQISAAMEGIARSLRAEDGNTARSNAWLLSIHQSMSANATTERTDAN
jgi:hypothetical protein